MSEKIPICKKHNIKKVSFIEFDGSKGYYCPACKRIDEVQNEFSEREKRRKEEISKLKVRIDELSNFSDKDKKEIEDIISKVNSSAKDVFDKEIKTK